MGTITAKIVGDQAYIECAPDDGQDKINIACVTLTGHDGRQTRAWLSVRIKPNGRAEARLDVLGKTKATDSHKTAWMPWHDAGSLAR